VDRILTKSGKGDRIVWGVCGGIAEYFRIDPTIVRLVWIFITLTYGIGLLIYIIAAIVIPEKGSVKQTGAYTGPETHDSFGGNSDSDMTGQTAVENADDWKTVPEKPKYDSTKSRTIIGLILIACGVLYILKQFFSWADFRYIVPAIIVLIGGLIIFAGVKRS
jgi:phage shock protein C